MLLTITNKCYEGCTHCMQDATPQGLSMPLDVFRKSLDFANNIGANIISITGGEPTTHPYFFQIMNESLEWANKYNKFIILESNGSFIENETFSNGLSSLLNNDRFISMQISTHKAYYPNYEKTVVNKDKFYKLSKKIVFVENPDIFLSALGRQKTIDGNTYMPQCTNLLILMRQLKNIQKAVSYLENHILFCKPSVDINGNIKAGESRFCQTIGTVDDTIEDISNKLLVAKPCGKCGLLDNLKKNKQVTELLYKSI